MSQRLHLICAAFFAVSNVLLLLVRIFGVSWEIRVVLSVALNALMLIVAPWVWGWIAAYVTSRLARAKPTLDLIEQRLSRHPAPSVAPRERQ